jgi:hypothetical protein
MADTKFQAQGDLLNLQRSALLSQYRKAVDDLADDQKKYPRLSAFLPQNLWPWVKSYLAYAFKSKHKFPSYPAQGERGIYEMAAAAGGQALKLSIAGDWGTGTEEAWKVASAMSKFDPDYTIHLGDVYYVGDSSEVDENCLGKSAGGYQGVTWPPGRRGKFALNGNHEMYANGNAYFDKFLPTLGIPSSQDKAQLASFFCLENDVWRILGLDTGYNSVGLPLLGQIPLLNKIPGVGADCKLENELMNWLRTAVKPKERPRATILLTHHQYYSAFQGGYTRPAKQLMEFFPNQDVIWIWGHEHRFAVYGKHRDGAMNAYGRCQGHGGMPVEIKQPSQSARSALQYYDNRPYATPDGSTVGFNGFVNLAIAGKTATFDYRDLNNKSLLVERFTANEGILAQDFVYVDPELAKGPAAPGSASERIAVGA